MILILYFSTRGRCNGSALTLTRTVRRDAADKDNYCRMSDEQRERYLAKARKRMLEYRDGYEKRARALRGKGKLKAARFTADWGVK